MTIEQGNSMTVEQLSGTAAWRDLSPNIRQILSIFFERPDRDLAAAVSIVHPQFSRTRAEAIADNIRLDQNVHAVLLIQSGAVVLVDDNSFSNLDDLYRHPEFRRLEPIRVRLHPGNIYDEGDEINLQRVLKLYYSSARENLLDALAMYRPDLSQESVAVVARAMHENESVRRMFAIRRGAR